MSQPICVLCAHYHPRTETHAPDRGQTCATGRRRLEHDVMVLRSSYRRLVELQTADVTGAKDAASRKLPAAPVPAPSKQPMVSGSKARTIPLTDVADLTAGAHPGGVHDPHHDQVGHHSVATLLNEWVDRWHEHFFSYQRRPEPTLEAMTGWLLGVRLELVADADAAIADFAQEIRDMQAVIRFHLGESPRRRAPMWGVPCPRCRLMSQLMLDPEDPDRRRECASCGKLMAESEYHAYLRNLTDQYRADGKLARGSDL